MLHISKFALPATFEKNVVFPRCWRERLGRHAAEHFNIFKVEMLYHLRFVSKRNGHTPYVGFAYADSIRQKQVWKQQQDAKKKEWETASLDGETVDLSALNFAYEVKGKARWKPERVYDDGRQVFIRLPDNAKSGEMPVLLVRKGKQDVLVNYRVREGAMIVDGVFDHIALVLGVGGDQEKVDIVRLKTGKGGK